MAHLDPPFQYRLNLTHVSPAAGSGNNVSSIFDPGLCALPAANEPVNDAQDPAPVLETAVPAVSASAESVPDPAVEVRADAGVLTGPRVVVFAEPGAAASVLLATTFVQELLVPESAFADESSLLAAVSAEVTLAVVVFASPGWAQERINALRKSAAVSELAIMAIGDADTEQRCQLLSGGADDLLHHRVDEREQLLRFKGLLRRQQAFMTQRDNVLQYPGSSAYNLDYLNGVGRTLYATAQRGHITLAVAVLRLTDGACEQVSDMADVISCCQSNLRDTDVFAQCAENEFVAVVTNVGRYNIGSIFERLSVKVAHSTGLDKGDRPLLVGATLDFGITFESMIHRARAALDTAVEERQLFALG